MVCRVWDKDAKVLAFENYIALKKGNKVVHKIIYCYYVMVVISIKYFEWKHTNDKYFVVRCTQNSASKINFPDYPCILH